MRHFIVRLRDPHSGILLQEVLVEGADIDAAVVNAYFAFWQPRWDTRFYEVFEVEDNGRHQAAT